MKRTKIREGEHTMKYQEHQPNSIGAKLVCNDGRFTFTWVLDKQKWTKQIIKQYFDKRLIMTNEDEEI